ncbi:MAG: hypothetical protein ACREA2_19975, partial [Blastocatellia bacterium]
PTLWLQLIFKDHLSARLMGRLKPIPHPRFSKWARNIEAEKYFSWHAPFRLRFSHIGHAENQKAGGGALNCKTVNRSSIYIRRQPLAMKTMTMLSLVTLGR